MDTQAIRAAIAASPELQALADAGNLAGVAAALSAAQPHELQAMKVADMFDVLFKSGDYEALKMAQLAGDPRAVFAFATLADARTLGPGLVNLELTATAALLDRLQQEPILLSQAGREALVAAATVQPDPIDWQAVKSALEGV